MTTDLHRTLIRGAVVLLIALLAAGCEGVIRSKVSCAANTECERGLCLLEGDVTVCGQACTDEQDCAAGETCSLTHDVADATVAACVVADSSAGAPGATCSGPIDCATGLCVDGLCVEMCTVCDAGQACETRQVGFDGRNVDVDVCMWRVNWESIELGPVTTPLAGSLELTFDLPAGIGSLTIVLVDDDGLRVAIKYLQAPDGTVLIDIDDGSPDLNPGFQWPGTASTLVPSTDLAAARPQAGTYRMRVGTFDPLEWIDLNPVAGSIERVFVIPERVGEEGGLLDLNLHFAPITGITADSAADDSFVQNMLAELNQIYRDVAQVQIGAVRFSEISTDHDTVEDGDEVRFIVSTYSEPGPNGASINMFLVGDLTFTSGYSAGRPGPPGVYGTTGSGVVAEILGNGRDTGVLLAHELGHFLGLYHSSELSGGGRDPISDSPECPGGSVITDCPDYTNLMFPMFPLNRTLVLSPGQARVLRGNPALYEVDRSPACGLTTQTYDITDTGFATGDSARLGSVLSGSCGGDRSPERQHLYRLANTFAGQLEIRVTGLDFAPLVHVTHGDCADTSAEMACESADTATEVVISLDRPIRGAYFITVDGRDGGGGTFILDVTEIPE